MKHFPDILTEYKKMSDNDLMARVMQIEGFSDITAKQIVDNIAWADKFVQAISKVATFKQVKAAKDLLGYKFVFTGFRDAKLMETVIDRGGDVSTSNVSKNTTAIVVKSKGGKVSGKLAKAMELGIPVYETQEFIDKFIAK